MLSYFVISIDKSICKLPVLKIQNNVTTTNRLNRMRERFIYFIYKKYEKKGKNVSATAGATASIASM